MRNSRCLFSTAAALHRIFIAPIKQSQFQILRRTLPYTGTSPKGLLVSQRRCIATSAPSDKRRNPRDDEIKSWSVSVVGEDNKLSEPKSTAYVLSTLDRKTQSLVVVVPGEPGVPPICKVMDKNLMRESERARAKAARSSGGTTKTIELNWAIDGNDLGHRVNKMKEFLVKGFKVEIVLAGKKKGRKATEDEAKALVERLRDVVKGVEGAKESRPMEGKLLAQAKLFTEGKAVQR